ncbi:ABC transporter permease [Chloroflexota bacterium]
MNKTLVILKHEFVNMVKSKGFIIMTLLFPLIALAAIGIYQITQTAGQPSDDVDIPRIGYVDEAGGFENYTGEFGDIVLVPYMDQELATDALLEKDVNEYFVIPVDYLQHGTVTRYHIEKELEMSGETFRAIRNFLQTNLLEGKIDSEIIERINNPLGVNSIRLNETGAVATDQGGFGAFILPLVFGFLLVIAIGTSSGTLLQGLGEEKGNRIMEILLSSVSTRQLLLGKVLGLGSAGLVQIIFWIITGALMLRLASNTIGGFFHNIQVPENFIVLGIVYFILGYLFFAVMQAGIGAIAANPKESPQIAVAFILPAILPFYVAIIFLRDNPDHVIGTILTLIPVTAPMSVFVRLGMSEIAVWELILSICFLVIGIVGGLLLAAKTFRIFLLMHGKTPKLGEVLRLLKQA